MRRLLASLMLAGLALSSAAPLAGRAPGDCPAAPATNHTIPALSVGMSDANCEHTDAAPCVSSLGCVVSPPAVAALDAGFLVPSSLTVIGMVPSSPLGDLYRTGPPTPPPDLI